MRVAILGLDCAAPKLVFDDWRKELPNLSSLIDEGCHGELQSCHPPITVPAWACMTSGQQAGQLGIYGFRNRKDHSYGAYALTNSGSVQVDQLWDILGREGKQSIVVGVPPSFPPKPIEGIRVGCFLTPTTKYPYTWPIELQAEIERVADGYVVDVDDFRTTDKAALLERIYDKTRKHMSVVKHLVSSKPWDFFMTVEMGTDRIHHGFWKYMDTTHRDYQPGNPFEHAIRKYYHYVDREVGEFVELLPPDTVVMVVSDHGAKKLDGCICFNEWLIEQGYLTVKNYPDEPTSMSKIDIDWSRTRAWGEGGYYGRLFLNVRGREPEGTIAVEDYEKVRDELIEKIAGIEDPEGRNIGCKAHRPEDLYRAQNGVAPDLIVYFGDLNWRSVGSIGFRKIHTFENDTGPDDANHDWRGIFIMRGPGIEPRPEALQDLQLFDVCPTVLRLFGLEPTPEMVGKSIL